ncbi:MAG: class I SAM-dependent methyltransferase [Cyanobacteria bacterium SID2]|nr:class I SAM-dependent methyltransferase [Cyanobacteria bacterium SID2]MBP0003574.1 class I SAM-dependent methyltransferase [Cyanobacteria bacterium SBC]
MTSNSDISAAVGRLYDTYPFPPEPLLDEPPPGYNWRWNWLAAYSFCTGCKPERQDVRILDAGCGTGVGTEYLVHLNPHARVTGIDLSEGALAVARERCQKSGAERVEFHHLSLYDVHQLEGTFDLINCVGVLHHLSDPMAGIRALASKLAPGGLMHVFVYSELGRREILLMQQALGLLLGDRRNDFKEGVRLGRKLFDTLPEDNRIVKEDKRRWSLENHRDANFADMYLHPQEIDYNIDTLFELIEASDLTFLGFSNPAYWQIDRLLGGDPELLDLAQQLSVRERYRAIELLDPELTHYEFFLGRPPILKWDWRDDDELRGATPELNPCIQGWPSQAFFDLNYQIVKLSPLEFEFLQACEGGCRTLDDILNDIEIDLDTVRSLQQRQLLLLTPKTP